MTDYLRLQDLARKCRENGVLNNPTSGGLLELHQIAATYELAAQFAKYNESLKNKGLL